MYLLGELLSKAIPFLLLPYLTRTLGPAGFGDLSLYQVIAALVFIVVGLNQDGALSRYYYVYGTRAIGLIAFTGILYSTIIFFLGCIFCYLYESEILFACICCAYTQSLINNQLTIRQMQKLVRPYLLIQFFNSIVSLLLTVLLFEYISASALGRLYVVVAANVLTCMIAMLCISGGALDSFRSVSLSYKNIKLSFIFIFAFGAPLIVHNLSLFSKGQLDRIFVYATYSDEQLGIYSAGFQIASILSILLMAANKSSIPYYYEGLKNKSISFLSIKKWIIYAIFFVPFPAVVAFIIPDVVYSMVLGGSFVAAKVYTVIFLLGIAMTLPYFIVVNYLFYFGKTTYVSISTALSSLLHIALIFTVGQIDMIYMAASLFVTNLLIFIVVYMFCRRVSLEIDAQHLVGK